MIRRCSAAEAQRLLQQDGTLAALLDVREKYEFVIAIGERDGVQRPDVGAICSRLAPVRASAPR